MAALVSGIHPYTVSFKAGINSPILYFEYDICMCQYYIFSFIFHHAYSFQYLLLCLAVFHIHFPFQTRLAVI